MSLCFSAHTITNFSDLKIIAPTNHSRPFLQSVQTVPPSTTEKWEKELKLSRITVYSPGGAVDLESSHCDLRVLQIDAVGQQRLDVLVALWLQLRGRGEVVKVLFNEVGHKLLVKGQLVVPRDYDLNVVRQCPCERKREKEDKKSKWRRF